MGFGQRILTEAERRLGVNVVPAGELEGLREQNIRFEQFMEEANELAYHALDYFHGRPQEMKPEYRNRLAQRSRVALMEDPLAGGEADHLKNFAFGRGVGIPDAEDPEVQKVIEEAWTDPVNLEKLTGFEAQRHRSDELLTQANLYPTAFVENGYVRLGFLDADTVTHIVTDPEDEERPLWYVTRKRVVKWDFNQDMPAITDEMKEGGLPKVLYHAHWRNVEDFYEDAPEGEAKPPAAKTGGGLVYHVRINRIGRSQFGTPPWARTLRFYSAMNTLTEAHVAMAHAASTIIAKRVRQGGPSQITQAANSILSQTGEIGASRFGTGEPPADIAARLPAPAPGSFWLENTADRLESVNLGSGASQAAQTAQIVRAPISAASGFGQHYLGDASNANLATATSLELPALMTVQAWQESFRQMLKWFVDLVIQEAVRSGRLGSPSRTLEEDLDDGVPSRVAAKALGELRLAEAEDKQEMERRLGIKLGYSLTMPYPGRRNLPDVTTTVTTVATSFDAQGMNVPLRRQLLLFLATHGLQLDDPVAFVDEVLPEETADVIARMAAAGMIGGNPGAPADPIDPMTGKPTPELDRLRQVAANQATGGQEGKSEMPKGVKTGSPPAREAERDLGEEVASLFDVEVIDPLLREDRNGKLNGHAALAVAAAVAREESS